jgi:competence protein ComEA
MSLRRTSSRTAFDDLVTKRLQRIADQWTPLPRANGPQFDRDDVSAKRFEPSASGGADWHDGDEDGFGADAGARDGDGVDGRRRLVMHLDRRGVRAVLALVALAVVVTGWMWWQGRPREVMLAPAMSVAGAPMAGAALGTAGAAAAPVGAVVVHVLGSVRNPGLVRLPAGSRVDDALVAAGGAKSEKARGSVNLARIVIDGEQIIVSADGVVVAISSGGSGGADSGPGIGLNTATATELEALPGVGPVLAERIVAWRTANGVFHSADELSEVSGIGDSILEQIRPLVHM